MAENVLYFCFMLSHFPCGSVDWNSRPWVGWPVCLCHFPCGSVDWNSCNNHCKDLLQHRHFPCGSVDWNFSAICSFITCISHFPCGSVDWNNVHYSSLQSNACHFPCGSVDWNADPQLDPCRFCVTSLAEVWIEIRCCRQWLRCRKSLPLRKCGLKFAMKTR